MRTRKVRLRPYRQLIGECPGAAPFDDLLNVIRQRSINTTGAYKAVSVMRVWEYVVADSIEKRHAKL